MNSKINNFIKNTKCFLGKHSPEILTGIGIAGMVSSTVLAVKATPKALVLLEEARTNEDGTLGDKLTIVETVKVAWKPYVPAIAVGMASISCIIGASRVNYKRNAALSTAYALSERTLINYRDKVVETLGEKKEKEVRDKISQDNIDKKPISSSQVIITPKGNTLFMDSITGRYFRSDLDSIKKAVIELNMEISHQNYISLNEFYTNIGLDRISNGDNLGWNIDSGYVEIDYSTCLADNDEPCIVIDYITQPKYDFDKFA